MLLQAYEGTKTMLILVQSNHKAFHKSQSNPIRNFIAPSVVSKPDPATGQFNPFPTYPYTGSLRPVYPLLARRQVPERIRHPDYASDGVPRSGSGQTLVGRNRIKILNQEEQQAMRKVCRLAREVLDIAAKELKPGVTTDHIDEVVHNACIERDVSMPLDIQ